MELQMDRQGDSNTQHKCKVGCNNHLCDIVILLKLINTYMFINKLLFDQYYLNFIWFSIIWNISPGWGILPVSNLDQTGTSTKYLNLKITHTFVYAYKLIKLSQFCLINVKFEVVQTIGRWAAKFLKCVQVLQVFLPTLSFMIILLHIYCHIWICSISKTKLLPIGYKVNIKKKKIKQTNDKVLYLSTKILENINKKTDIVFFKIGRAHV